MRTTIDVPEDLVRQVKAQAALRGMKLKDYVEKALRTALHEVVAEAPPSRSRTGKRTDRLVLGEKVSLPLITGPCGPLMKGISGEKINELLEAEELGRAVGARGR